MLHELSSTDCIFLSYDEPNAEENYSHLVNICPWAKRVHGMKGFDAVHKAAAALSETERFISVDADNKVLPEFFDLKIDLKPTDVNHVFSWAGRNTLNGLVYGNGGLKLWTREIINRMRSHEVAVDEQNRVDFCWDLNYKHMNDTYSDVYVTGSPLQAFRAGFREGVKMTLDRGHRVNPRRIPELINEKNYKRLLVWCSIGADVENGEWAIYGARLGAWLTNSNSGFDISKIASYDWFSSYWEEITGEFEMYKFPALALSDCIRELGDKLRKELLLPVAEFDTNASLFFKTVYEAPPRIGVMIKEEDL